MLEQKILAAFEQSTATLQRLDIRPASPTSIELYVYLTYEPHYYYRDEHLTPLAGLADYRVVEARIQGEGNLFVTVSVYPNLKAA